MSCEASWGARSISGLAVGSLALAGGCRETPSVVVGGNVASAACLEGPTLLLDEVEFVPQEATNWCWAAAGQMVMRYHQHDHEQCEQAYVKTGKSECRCENNPAAREACNVPSWPVVGDFQFGYECDRSSPLTWQKLQRELCGQQPFMFTWKWPYGRGSHMMVAVGYRIDQDASEKYVSHLDPASLCSDIAGKMTCIGDYSEVTYAFFREDEAHHSHSRTYYDVRPGGTGARSWTSWLKCEVF